LGRRLAFGSGVVLIVAAAALLAAALTSSLWWHSSDPAASPLRGLRTVAFSVRPAQPPPGAAVPDVIVRRCALLADTMPERDRGLMFVRDLAGYDGMVFRWPAETTEAFYMKDTLIPLSVAWFDGYGRFVSSADMAPCPEATVCPLFSAAAPYTVAIEVPQGELTRLGIGPGSSLTLAGGCR
jgi:uncharacterized membrane protein (UPF0127 family)